VTKSKTSTPKRTAKPKAPVTAAEVGKMAKATKAKVADVVEKGVAKAVGRPPKDAAATKKSSKASKKAATAPSGAEEPASAGAPAEADVTAVTAASG